LKTASSPLAEKGFDWVCFSQSQECS